MEGLAQTCHAIPPLSHGPWRKISWWPKNSGFRTHRWEGAPYCLKWSTAGFSFLTTSVWPAQTQSCRRGSSTSHAQHGMAVSWKRIVKPAWPSTSDCTQNAFPCSYHQPGYSKRSSAAGDFTLVCQHVLCICGHSRCLQITLSHNQQWPHHDCPDTQQPPLTCGLDRHSVLVSQNSPPSHVDGKNINMTVIVAHAPPNDSGVQGRASFWRAHAVPRARPLALLIDANGRVESTKNKFIGRCPGDTENANGSCEEFLKRGTCTQY